MAYVDVTSEKAATFGTHSHGEETLAPRGGAVPAQLKWSDLHPPGVKVLPKGSPPAGEGEINWEDTLGGKFALALEKLEGLLYAVWGSRPAAYNMSGTWRKCQWYDRVHPRCLWGPEVWERRLYYAPPNCNIEGQCWDYQPTGKEYAARGDSPPCCPLGGPSVPIRSRSGDPQRQYVDGVHHATVFPPGSVAREHEAGHHDPKGFGWFGATQPGRNDAAANPWLATANGYVWEPGQSVKVFWTAPQGVPAPTTLNLRYKTKPPGGAWSSWSLLSMYPYQGKYMAEIPAKQHGTECRWYLSFYWHDPNEELPDIVAYEPGGNAAPALDDAHYFQWFKHYNPYGSGLPEMLADYGGVDVRHGTDFFQFDGSETIQPGLLNLVRWTLSWLGGDCCTGEYEHCAETDYRTDVFHHNPRQRGADQGICCVPMPIKFRWSGSNVHPYYVAGGKAGPLDTRPLHNRADDAGSQAARKTWRGINMLYAGNGTTFDNPYYGGGYSWGTAPGTFILQHEPDHSQFAQVWAKYPTWGLRSGDVIDAVHIQEVIDAVDYLIDNGVWTTDPIKSCKQKPDSYLGQPCQKNHHHWTAGPEGQSYPFQCTDPEHGKYYTLDSTVIKPCWGCCYNADEFCWHPSAYVIVDRTYQWVDEQGNLHTDHEAYTDNPYNQHCDPFPATTWQDCWNQNGSCTPGKCLLGACKSKSCTSWPRSAHQCWNTEYFESTGCNGGLESLNCEWPPFAGGFYRCGQNCTYWDAWDEVWRHCTEAGHWGTENFPCGAGYQVGVGGLSYQFCTGTQCRPGWDANHGGGHVKQRVDHSWPHNLKATGPPGGEASGNCFGDIYVCGVLGAGDHPNVWFQSTRSVNWDGFATSWWTTQCDCTTSTGGGCPPVPYYTDPPPIPGWGVHDEDGDPLCMQYYHDGTYGGYQMGADGTRCSASASSFAPCLGNAAWVATDLNLDGSGRPYRTYGGLDGENPPYTGRGVPRLRDYDLTKDPATWMHACPCETWANEADCDV